MIGQLLIGRQYLEDIILASASCISFSNFYILTDMRTIRLFRWVVFKNILLFLLKTQTNTILVLVAL